MFCCIGVRRQLLLFFSCQHYTDHYQTRTDKYVFVFNQFLKLVICFNILTLKVLKTITISHTSFVSVDMLLLLIVQGRKNSPT